MASVSVSSTLMAAALLLLTYLLASTLYQWYRLRNVPGPFLASFSSLWVLGAILSANQSGIYRDLPKKYGHLVRVGPNDLITDDPEVLKRMSRARSPYGKDSFYASSLKHPDHDNMFSTLDVAAHDRIKAKLLGPYSGRETDAMEPIVDGFLVLLVQYLRDKTREGAGSNSPGTVVDLAPLSAYFTMDIITRVAFGKELGFLRSDSDVYDLLKQTGAAVKFLAVPLGVPWLRKIILSRPFMDRFGPKATDKKGFGAILNVCEKAINARYQPGAPDEKDLLGGFVRQGIPQGLCLSESMFTLGAGSETTASVIRFTMLHLITLPRAYNKLKQTVATAVQGGLVSSPIRQEEAKKLPYLQAVIYEGLRMRPPVPLMFPKVVPPEGDVIDGKFIPGGTAVGWNLLALMRSPEYFGADAERFRPERFLDDVDEEARGARERLVDMVFGFGRFACAGRPLAMMELSKTFFELFRYFDFQIANPEKPVKSEFWSVFVDKELLMHVEESHVEESHDG